MKKKGENNNWQLFTGNSLWRESLTPTISHNGTKNKGTTKTKAWKFKIQMNDMFEIKTKQNENNLKE